MANFKVGDRVRALVPPSRVSPGDMGVVTGVISDRVKVRFDKYPYSCKTYYHGMHIKDLELVKSKARSKLTQFIKQWEKKYDQTTTSG